MGPRALFTQGLRTGNRAQLSGRAAAFAVVLGRPLERLDLQRHAVDGDHAHLLTGGRRASPGWCGPASAPTPTLTTPSGSTSSTTSPSSPIIHSRPIVGVAKRVRTIDGIPTTKARIVPPMPASSVIHDGRSVTPGRSSNSSRLPIDGEHDADTGPQARHPDLDVDGEGQHRQHEQGRPPSRASGGRPARCTPGRGTRPRRSRRRRRRR